MRAIRQLCFIFCLLLAFAHRLPAPIQEEAPTPAPERPARQKPKPKAELKSGAPFNIPQSQMTASATSDYSGYEASKAIDGKVDTIWHTPWGLFGPEISLPQSITLNLGSSYKVNKLRYLPRRKSGIGDLNGNILTYKIYVSTDGSNFAQIAAGNWSDDHSEKSVTFAPAKASYIRLEAVATHGSHASAAELNVTATQ